MNTEKERLLDKLIEGICSRNQSHTNEFILAEYIANVVFRGGVSEASPELMDEYQSLMLDFQGKCDELVSTQIEVTDLRSAHCMLQEQFNSVERAIKGMRGDYNELNNSKAALQRDYDQLTEALSLQNSECIDLLAERDSLRAANANGTEILANTRAELTKVRDQLDYVTRSQINGMDDDKSRELILTLRDIGVHLGAHHENATTLAAWVKQNVPADFISSGANTNLNLASTITELRSQVAFLQGQLDGYHGKAKTPRAIRRKEVESAAVEEVDPNVYGER